MSMLKGIPVVLHVKTVAGYDDFGAPIETETTETIENVLVYPASSNDVTDSINLHGVAVQYQLCIPKRDNHIWRDTEVEFFGETWRTVGEPKKFIEDLLPLDWNMQIMVARNE